MVLLRALIAPDCRIRRSAEGRRSGVHRAGGRAILFPSSLIFRRGGRLWLFRSRGLAIAWMTDAQFGRDERAIFYLAGTAHAVADVYFSERSGRAAGHELQQGSALDSDLLRLVVGTRHRNLVLVDCFDPSGNEGLAEVRRVHSLAALATHHRHI